jgi:NAD(P)-dependent dehydrogenase (short-subunit alcohol dehydrogenase family)
MSEWLGLTGRAVLVAGAGGIGAAIAIALADVGARVVVVDVDGSRLESLQQKLATQGHRIDVIKADLTSAQSCRDVVEEATTTLGGLDVLMHAVGINDRRPVIETPDEVWETIMKVNLSSAYWLGQAAGRVMQPAGHGRIIFLSSVSGLLAHADHAPYAASKGGLNQLMRVMAREWASSGVTVNAVAPGYTETDLTRDYLGKPGMREGMTKMVPAGRLGTQDDVVGPMLFLASDQAAFVTGHVLYVDGGRVLV